MMVRACFTGGRFDGNYRDMPEDEAAHELCKRCGIASRTELHGNSKAQALFDALIKDFEEATDDF